MCQPCFVTWCRHSGPGRVFAFAQFSFQKKKKVEGAGKVGARDWWWIFTAVSCSMFDQYFIQTFGALVCCPHQSGVLAMMASN